MADPVFFDNWQSLVRTAVILLFAYPGMLLMVRLSGKRSLAKLNAFDFIVTIALGSTLASVVTSRDVALAQGLLAFALLILFQGILSWLASRSDRLERFLNGEPELMLHKGELLRAAMRRARIAEEEILSAVRSQGLASFDEVEAVVLETNGQLNVVRTSDTPAGPPLESLGRV